MRLPAIAASYMVSAHLAHQVKGLPCLQCRTVAFARVEAKAYIEEGDYRGSKAGAKSLLKIRVPNGMCPPDMSNTGKLE